MTAPAEIDRLIEEGLTLYGQGDLDGALQAWELALSEDPDNAQASSYVDYVRQNYDLLTGDLPNDEARVPFGLDDEPYQIEVLPGEVAQPSPPLSTMDELDAGWDLDGDEDRRSLEIEADEPPLEDRTTQTAPVTESAEGSESDGEFAELELTPGVASGFSTQPTHVKERDTGFVRASSQTPDTAQPRSKRPSELTMTLRTPRGDTNDPFAGMGLPSDQPPASSTISLSYDDPASGGAGGDLISSLPSPTPAALAGTRTDTAELPPSLRPPAGSPDHPSMSATTTQDFESQKTNAQMPKPDRGSDKMPTRELTDDKLPFRQMVSAPTRDLGLRPPGVGPGPDDLTTTRKAAPPAVGDETRGDVYLPFDPIDARSAQILDEIDEGAPEREDKEDRTRRRITTLFERAVGWGQAGELDRAVAAIDLALSEDPNSALAQKLIHRNRDTMMSVFQSFLGDLDRQPMLARPLHELANAPISPRAAFLLSRVDGTLSLDELLDVSGMPKIEAYRYLCQLFLRGILR